MRKDNSGLNNEVAIEWYTLNRNAYKQLAFKVHNIINEVLVIKKINFHAIFNRVKELESFKEKIKDPKYSNPQEQITDLAGIRIICYVESDIEKICKVIEENFDIDDENSGDKSKLLGTDRVGYKSIHYVAKLNRARLVLPEYQSFSNSKFEIQIRTILQHAWAEIEHDRNYKFSGELPHEIQRRFKLVAGILELADKEFNRIASDIDKINVEVEKGTKSGNIDYDINSTTLKQFLTTKFEYFVPNVIKPTFPDKASELKIVNELRKYGLKTLSDLNEIIPTNFIANLKKSQKPPTNFLGLLRIIMICHDWKRYFDNAYTKNFVINTLKERDILVHYNVPVDKIDEEYSIKKI